MSVLLAETWKDIFTIGTASIGAVLGIMNTWNSINSRRLRVKVTPHFLVGLDGEPVGASIEVINLSGFPVTIVEAGFEVGGGQIMPLLHTPTSLPHRLDARESMPIYFDPRAFVSGPNLAMGAAYVRTACGNRIKGNSPAGRQMSQILAEVTKDAV